MIPATAETGPKWCLCPQFRQWNGVCPTNSAAVPQRGQYFHVLRTGMGELSGVTFFDSASDWGYLIRKIKP